MTRNIMMCLSVASSAMLWLGSAHAVNDLYISEYVEGSSYNKALEIYNGTGSNIDLSAYEVQFYFNGSTTLGRTISLTGSVAAGDVFVLTHASADAAMLTQTDQTTAGSWFNGDDAVLLLNGGTIIDAIGQVGADPGVEWGSGNISTQDHTLRRKPSIDAGDADAYNNFDPAVEWDGFVLNTFDNLGTHDGGGGTPPSPSPAGQIVINEVDADTAGADRTEFVELFDGGAGNMDLNGYVLVLYNGNDDSVYASYDLSGYRTSASGYFVVGNAAVAGVDLVISDARVQNGADAVALYQAGAVEFPVGGPISLVSLIDAVVYDTNDADDPGLLTLLNTGEPQLNEDGNGNKDVHSNQRCANGAGGTRITHGFVQAPASPGASNACGATTACGTPATLIHAIQGTADISPMAGQTVEIQAVVTGDFRNTTNGLSGFFIQEEPGDMDADVTSSEGLFVNDNGFGVNIAVGDVVRLTGTVAEYFGLTEVHAVTSIEVCATGAASAAIDVVLPLTNAAALERYEGMLIHLPQTLSVTENYDLGRYGEVVVASGGRLYTPTNVVAPGAPAVARQAANDLNRLVIDDGNVVQNPDPIVYPAPGLSALNTLRSGDTVMGLTGVISYTAGAYRMHPTQAPQFTAANPRTPVPTLAGGGSLRVASFNLLNFFNGDGQGGGFPTARGATTSLEFSRQRSKIIAAITAMSADIIGLMELENDGYGANSAIQDLVNGLNAAAPTATSYRFVDPGVTIIGTDAITVGLIYRNETVRPGGHAVILDGTVDSRFDDNRNRPSLAQTFVEIATTARLTVAVNHLKSKGSSCAASGDPDTGDGQGNCNLTRTRAAQALVDWLAGDPTGSGDSDALIIGDLNSYAMEDPISAIVAGNYTNLITSRLGAAAYSYVFMGQAGNLDHALASASLAAQVSGVTDWHINADEPHVLDYNEEFKSANQVLELYNSDAYRASDHDPVVIELQLTP